MPLDLVHLFSINYLFNLSPGPMMPVFFKFVLPFFILLAIFGFIFHKLAKLNNFPPVKKFFIKICHFLLTIGILGLAYLFFRQQNVYLFSAPFWLAVLLISSLVWLSFIMKYYFTNHPAQIKEVKKEKDKKKYLP